ncbi:Htr4 family protein [Megaselia abdita]
MSESLNIFLLVLESFVTLLVVFGNSLVLASVIRNKKLRTISNKLIFSLSVANILAGLGTLTMDIILDCDLIQSKVFCSISFGFYQYAVTITIHHLCIISIDKYLAIVHALRYTIIVQEQRLKYILIGCWAPGIPICFFPILVGGYYDSKSAGFSRNCIFAYNGLWLLLDILIFWIPCVIIIFTYTMIFRAVRHQVRSINRQSNSRSSSDSSKPSYRKPFITLGLISGSFLICWTPTFLLYENLLKKYL